MTKRLMSMMVAAMLCVAIRSDGLPVLYGVTALHWASYYKAADSAGITSGSLTATVIDTVIADTDGYRVGSNNYYTIPAGLGGKYLVCGNTLWGGNATGVRLNEFYKSTDCSTSVIEGFYTTPNAGNPGNYPCFIMILAAGNNIGMCVYQNSGSNSLTYLGTSRYNNFQISLVGQ